VKGRRERRRGKGGLSDHYFSFPLRLLPERGEGEGKKKEGEKENRCFFFSPILIASDGQEIRRRKKKKKEKGEGALFPLVLSSL